MMIWVVLMHFASGMVEPMFAYATKADCDKEIVLLAKPTKGMNVTTECVPFGQLPNSSW